MSIVAYLPVSQITQLTNLSFWPWNGHYVTSFMTICMATNLQWGLTYVLTTAMLDATNFSLIYRSRRKYLSGLPSDNKETLINNVIETIRQGMLATKG